MQRVREPQPRNHESPSPVGRDPRRASRGPRFRLLLAVLVFGLLPAQAAWAAIGAWSGGDGPTMDWVEAIDVDPFDSRHLLAVGLSGLRVSRDGGSTWASAGFGPDGISTIAFHPGRRGVIYVGGTEAVYRSTDGGRTWSPASMPAPVLDVTVDPRDGDRIYATLGSSCGVCGASYVRVSDDAGVTWRPMAEGTSGSGHFELVVDPVDSDVLYLGTTDAIWKSVDRGVTWTDVTPPASVGLDFEALWVAGGSSGEPGVYAGGRDGVFRSLDGGATWILTGAGPRFVRALRATGDGTLLSASARGIHRSTDGGATWVVARPSAGSIDALALALDPRSPGVIYAGAWGDGLIRSRDGGLTWGKVETGTAFVAPVARLVVAPEVPAALYAAAQGQGVQRSVDGGRTWEPRNTGLTVDRVDALAVAPADPEVLYAGTQRGIFRTEDGGKQWSPRPLGLSTLDPEASEIDALAIDPRSADRVYAAGRNGVYGSVDGGLTWTHLLDLSSGESIFARDLDLDPHDPDHLVATSRTDAWQSFDGGESWSRIEAVDSLATLIFSWTWEPLVPGVAWVATSFGIYRTTDGGATWSLAEDGLCEPSCGLPREVVWVAPDRLVARDPSALWQSADGGETWQFFDTGGLSSLTLVAHPWSPGTLYLGGLSGVYNQTVLDCDTSTTLCLQDARFRLEIGWRDFENRRGQARFVTTSTAASTVGWFFDPDNWEVLGKVVDGGDFDDHFWVFGGVASNVETVLRVTDIASGRARNYHSPLGQTPETLAEIGVFPVDPPVGGPVEVVDEVVEVARTPEPALATGFDPAVVGQPCVANAVRACLEGGRFGVEVGWADFLGRTGHGRRVGAGTDDSSLWWFFGDSNWELLLKVIDGCATNDHHWLFAAGTTNLGLTLEVTDYATGEQVVVTSEVGRAMPTVTEIEAFGGC